MNNNKRIIEIKLSDPIAFLFIGFLIGILWGLWVVSDFYCAEHDEKGGCITWRKK